MSKIAPGQMRLIWQRLNSTEEAAWRDEYVADASNQRVTSVAELSMDEAHVMLSLLDDVRQGLRKPCNPHSRLFKSFQQLEHTIPSIPVKESLQDKENRLRRNVLRYCHDMGSWYVKDAEENLVLKNGKPVLDYSAIDAYCIAHTAAKKKLNSQNPDELTKTIYQFKKMAENKIYKTK